MYAIVQNNTVVELLPDHIGHHFSETVVQSPVSLSAAQKVQFGVLPVVDNLVSYDRDIHYHDGFTHTVTGDTVTRTYNLQLLTLTHYQAMLAGAQERGNAARVATIQARIDELST